MDVPEVTRGSTHPARTPAEIADQAGAAAWAAYNAAEAEAWAVYYEHTDADRRAYAARLKMAQAKRDAVLAEIEGEIECEP